MYSETDRTWIRHFGGWGAIYQQADPRLEGAIGATQSVADGGTRPDSNGENQIKALLYGQAAVAGVQGVTVSGTAQNTVFATPAQRGLIQIEATIAMQDTFLGTASADAGEVKINPAREMIRLRSEGRRLVYSMCLVLGLQIGRAHV